MRPSDPKMAVDHQGPRAAAVGGEVGRLEPLRQHAVELHGAALPGSAETVAQRELRASEP
jgi:hypothetical protein